MTENEWLSTGSPGSLLREADRRHISERKRHLFGCACCQRFWQHLPVLSQVVLSRCEEEADGRLDRQRLGQLFREANEVAVDVDRRLRSLSSPSHLDRAQGAATAAVQHAALGNPWCHEGLGKFDPSEFPIQAALLRDIFGNPFRPVSIDPAWLTWNNATVPAIARHIYEDRAFHDLPFLADALEDAGCTDADLLGHCRGPGPHVRGCWAVDLLLGKS